MVKEDMRDKVNNFLDNKGITNSFERDCIIEFVQRHTELFGSVVSEEDLLKRMESNLDKVTFAGPRDDMFGEYKGRISNNTDQNEIFLYYDYSDLELSDYDKKMWDVYSKDDQQKLLQQMEARKNEIKSTLLHELVHATYNIKGEYGIDEYHMFDHKGMSLFGVDEYMHVGGNMNFIEAITNYISSRIEGKSDEEVTMYKHETTAIYMLTDKMDENAIIQAAWNSDELAFQKSYEESIGDSYDKFNKQMNNLVRIRKKRLELSEEVSRSKAVLSKLEQILDGKDIEVEQGFKEILPLKKMEGKNALEDVSNANIRRPFLDKAISFLKDCVRNINKTDKNKEDR